MADIDPISLALTLVGGILPALVWLIFWLREDNRHPEPRWLLASIFLGGAFAVVPTYLVQEIFRQAWQLGTESNLINTVLTWAATEEIFKYLAVAFIALPTRYFDEPVDVLIYMITAALGFAAAENSLFMINVLSNEGGQLLSWISGNFRFVGSTIVHVVSSAILGTAIAITYCEKRSLKFLALIIGLCTATFLHALFNYLIIKSDSGDLLKIFILFWALAIVIIYLFERVKIIACHLENKL